MRILILGGGGMQGHRLFLHLRAGHEVAVTLRKRVAHYARHGIFEGARVYDGLDAADAGRLREAVEDFRPQAIVNCIGIVKQLASARESIPSIEVNALLPHRIAGLAREFGARVLHFSTDCVFSGRKGGYVETDTPDAEDLYGRTKLLGEVAYDNCLTLRTSLVGHELERGTSLLEWFLAQRGRVRGFRRFVFSGLSTIETARIVEMCLTRHPDLSGVWHVSAQPIDKCTLLELFRKHFGVDIAIEPDDEVQCDRSLDSTRFRERVGYEPPSWERMVSEMSGARDVPR